MALLPDLPLGASVSRVLPQPLPVPTTPSVPQPQVPGGGPVIANAAQGGGFQVGSR
jgi:hypothetical protein